jgi:hypothetical protein
MPALPGILLVASKIKDLAVLDRETFRRWYEEVHVPDILATSGIDSAFRFVSPTPEEVEQPYLALYPIKDLGWLAEDEFWSIPLHSDILPNPSKHIHDVADFHTAFYETVTTEGNNTWQGTKASNGRPSWTNRLPPV